MANNQFVELPKEKAEAFRQLCRESGIASQVFYGSAVNRVYPKCAPADFEALKDMFASVNNGTPAL